MKNKVKKIFLMILLCNIVVLIVPFYTHAAQKGWVKVGKTYRYRVQSSYVKNRVKKIKGNTVTVTFKNVKSGTYYIGLHAWTRTSEDNSKTFSEWSNVRKVKMK